MEEREVFLDPQRHLLMLPQRCMTLGLRPHPPQILDPQTVDLLWEMADDAWREQFPTTRDPRLVRLSIHFSMLTMGLTRIGEVQTAEPAEPPVMVAPFPEDPCFPRYTPPPYKWDNALVLSSLPNDELDVMKVGMGLEDSNSFQEILLRHLNDAADFAVEKVYECGMSLLPEGPGEKGLFLTETHHALGWVKEFMGEVPEGLHASYLVDLQDGNISHGTALRDEVHSITALWYEAVNLSGPTGGGAPVGIYLFGLFDVVLVEPTQNGARLVVTIWEATGTSYVTMSGFTEALRLKADELGGGFEFLR